jgi:hypothetical protein
VTTRSRSTRALHDLLQPKSQPGSHDRPFTPAGYLPRREGYPADGPPNHTFQYQAVIRAWAAVTAGPCVPPRTGDPEPELGRLVAKCSLDAGPARVFGPAVRRTSSLVRCHRSPGASMVRPIAEGKRLTSPAKEKAVSGEYLGVQIKRRTPVPRPPHLAFDVDRRLRRRAGGRGPHPARGPGPLTARLR